MSAGIYLVLINFPVWHLQKWIVAIFVLHNIVTTLNDNWAPTVLDEDSDDDDDDEVTGDPNQDGENLRNRLKANILQRFYEGQ